ncbi:MAG TPA: EAL domain-containing protein [Gemmatimonadales bacterium]|nr:EAL domain-containing protein [Gemmatimonadales bacterium]
MTLQPRPLRSRFGRRLLMLFVGCAVVPIALVASISYRHVTRYLEAQSSSRLDHASEALAQAMFERLLLLDATLKSIPPIAVKQLLDPRTLPPTSTEPAPQTRLPHGSRTRTRLGAERQTDLDAGRWLSTGLDLLASRRFVALEFVADNGRRTPVFGQMEELPPVATAERADLAAGVPLIVTRPGPRGERQVYLIRRIGRAGEAEGMLVGEVRPEFLWGSLDLSLPSRDTRITIRDDSGHLLFAKTAAEAGWEPDAQMATPPSAAAAVSPDPYISSTQVIYLDEVFSGPVWTLILSQSRDDVLGPMVSFTRMFLLVVVLASLLVLIVSNDQIRRSLVPLQALQQGTRRIAERDFSSRITVRSGDELEELAESFNSMAGRLDRQFQALSTAAEIDRAVLAATDADEIVGTLLCRMPDIYPCDIVGVILMAPDGAKSLPAVTIDYAANIRHDARIDLHAEDVQDLLEGAEVRLVQRTEENRLPAYLAPLGALGAASFCVLPLRYQHQLVGVVALGDRGVSPADEDARIQARRVADQVAIALANARMLQQVRTLAYVDSLTGLPNRLSYKDRLASSLEEAGRHGRLVAALFIDLDHFSRINDTLGHEAGDHLLQLVAGRLRASCREREDEVVPASSALDPEVARLGGDEFTVIMPGLADPEDAAKLARRILSSLAHPFRLEGREIFVNASIGIAIYPYDGEDLEMLLMHADTAMYKAKEQGGGSYQAYSRAMNASALQRLTLEHSLRRGLEREEFEVHYQPIVEARTGRPVAAEALVRWRHPDLGLLMPSEFVPLAEENGLIVPLGEWVIQRACLQNRAWQMEGLPALRVVVNLSSRQLRRGMTETVARILQTTGLDARYLGLELTESVLVNHQKEGVVVLHALRAMGLHLSVDDFGTGYSSFSYLKHFPLDALKIDRTFVREITTDPDDAAITTAIIAMGHALGLRVVGEGVETAAHQAVLRRQGCDELQGYHFSRPVPAERFAAYLAAATTAGRRARGSGAA